MASLKKILPMEALSVAKLPQGKEWRYEPKWDGFRCLAYKQKGKVTLQSKSGKPLSRYFPDVMALLEGLKAETFILDGELIVETQDGISFSDLQLRLHPAASRVNKLASEQPATYVLFDLLQDEKGQSFMNETLATRRKKLETFFKTLARQKHLKLSPQTSSLKEAQAWSREIKGLDGLIAKNIRDLYLPEERQMQKFKFVRTADCVVGGFRYGTDSNLVGSLLLGLYDKAGKLNHVGFTSALARKDKPALTKKLEALKGEGFTGKSPGGPSRWSTERSGQWVPLQPKLVVEVSFDHVSDGRFRHGTKVMRWRPDKAPKQCKMEQLYQAPAKLA